LFFAQIASKYSLRLTYLNSRKGLYCFQRRQKTTAHTPEDTMKRFTLTVVSFALATAVATTAFADSGSPTSGSSTGTYKVSTPVTTSTKLPTSESETYIVNRN
jgi:hypothetical protein